MYKVVFYKELIDLKNDSPFLLRRHLKLPANIENDCFLPCVKIVIILLFLWKSHHSHSYRIL